MNKPVKNYSTLMSLGGQVWLHTNTRSRWLLLTITMISLLALVMGFSSYANMNKLLFAAVLCIPVFLLGYLFGVIGGVVSGTAASLITIFFFFNSPTNSNQVSEYIDYLTVFSLIAAGYFIGRLRINNVELQAALIKGEEEKAKLLSARDHYQTLFENAADAIFVHTFDGDLLEVNQLGCELLGISHREIANECFIPMKQGEHYDEEEITRNIVESGNFIYESSVFTRQGRKIPIELSSRSINHQGRMCILSIARNISDKKFNDQLRALQIELGTFFTKTADLNSIVEVLIQKLSLYDQIDSGCILVPNEMHNSFRVVSEMGYVQQDFIRSDITRKSYDLPLTSEVQFGFWNEIFPQRKSEFQKNEVPRAVVMIPVKLDNWQREGLIVLSSYGTDEFSNNTHKVICSIISLIKTGVLKVLCELELKDAYYQLGIMSSQIKQLTSELEKSISSKTKALDLASSKFRALFEGVPIAIYRTSKHGVILDANPAMVTMLGFPSRKELLATNANTLYVDPDYRNEQKHRLSTGDLIWGDEFQLKKYDGTTIWVRDHAHAVRDSYNEIIYYEGSLLDVTEQKRYEARLVHDAFHDMLTGLPNRNILMDSLENIQSNTSQKDIQKYGVLFIDMDDFKSVNDTYGHPVGDMLLISLARRLENACRGGDLVCRFGGDEFVIVVKNILNREELENLANRLLEEIQFPYHIKGNSIRVTASVGCLKLNRENINPEKILELADLAMYAAKESGKGRVRIIDDRHFSSYENG